MSGAGNGALIGLLTFLLGTVVGTISSAPDPRIITETKEIEVVREVEVPVEVVKEVEVPTSPDECSQLAGEARSLANRGNRLAMQYQEAVDNLDDFDLNLVRTTNQEAINNSIVEWSKSWLTLSNTLYDVFEANDAVHSQWVLCKKATQE